MRILVPADFTEKSKRAASYAATLAESLGAELTLVHIHQPIVSKNNPVYAFGADQYADIKKDVGIHMGEYYHELFKEPYSKFTGITRIGRTADEIALEAAQDENSIIIMGTDQKDGWTRWVHGSKTAEVIEKSDHPVLVIPSEGKYNKPEKISFITGCDSYDYVAIDKLIRIARAMEAALFLVHISTNGKKGDNKVFHDFCDRIKLQSRYEKIYSQIVKETNVLLGISRYLKTHNPDLISFNIRKGILKRRLLQKSFPEKISSMTELPLLIFHRP